MPITFMGLSSVLDRTLFTKRGPIAKKPIALLIGTNLQVVSETDIYIPTGNFNSTYIGYTIKITGSQFGRNDGTFTIKDNISSTRLRLQNVNFNITDIEQTTAQVVDLANELKYKYNLHRVASGIHGSNDLVDVVTAPLAVNLNNAITLLNDIRAKFGAHVINTTGSPKIHSAADTVDIPIAPAAGTLAGAVILANDLRAKYENHRTLNAIHVEADFIDMILVPAARVITGVVPGAYTGPFSWTIFDPRLGLVADASSDVLVKVNGNPASVDAVFGLLGAVVLTSKPALSDSVLVDYSYIYNPPARLTRLNSPEFNLNQDGNNNLSGFPDHRYRARSYLVRPGHSPDFMSAIEPLRIGWKYKAYERAYSAVLNDPTSLLLNVPSNKLVYPVLSQFVPEAVVKYDPTTLPQNATDPWTLEGQGNFALAPGGSELTIVDNVQQTGPCSRPPFFTHKFDTISSSHISAAFRGYVSAYTLDGGFTGVGFGISDGNHVALIGCLETNATSLSSAITRINVIKSKFNAHLIQSGVHVPNDPLDSIIIVDAKDLSSLIILSNEIKSKFNAHLSIGGMPGVHQTPDIVNPITLPNASDLDTSINLVNALATSFNAHRTQTSIHFVNDTTNVVGLVKQVGILTNRGAPELELSWNSFSIDWTIVRTYRIFRDEFGNVSIFLSGDVAPRVSVTFSDLPAISDLDGRFDPLQQIFFGSIEREATSTSQWNFIRANINPLDSNLIGDNKSVTLTTIPELDPVAPWITVGQGGIERIPTGTTLIVDSTCSAPVSNIPYLGLSSGAYRGFLRLEPILTGNTTCAFEFVGSIDYYTFGVDNRAASVYMDDDNFSIQLAFIQFSPSPATITGVTVDPLSLISGDTIKFSIQDGLSTTVMFGTGDTVATVIGKINFAVGFAFADNNSGHLRLTAPSSGAESKFSIISGSAVTKLGLSPGVYYGLDSNPEPRVSWFGENLPDQDYPLWIAGGNQSVRMLGRVLRITDADDFNYKAYTVAGAQNVDPACNPSVDWKLDFRLQFISFTVGDAVPASPPYAYLNFAGALVSIDEGMSGKNIELQLSLDSSGNPFLNLLSYNFTTTSLDVKSQYAFNWNDGEIHSFNIYTNKTADTILVLADGIVLSPYVGPAPTYSGMNTGASGPSVTFGSGGEPVVGADLRNAKSVVDWHSVAVFRDSKIADPTAASRRYIGIYKGGDVAVLNSYYLHQIDWSSSHKYRIVRDPVNAVNVYVDSGTVPVISASYDILTLPPVQSSFFKDITNSRPTIAFGSFNPNEIQRTRWLNLKYSVGKITITDRRIPPHQVLDQANAVVSPEHLNTQKKHSHWAFRVYSGGTPTDEFLADSSVPAFTILGEGTPPVPATQNLETRGGLVKTVTPLNTIDSVNLVNTPGFLTDFENDVSNIITVSIGASYASNLTSVINTANEIKTKYNAHRVQAGIHALNDGVNSVVSPNAVNLATSITLLNEIKTKYNAHRVQAGIHSQNDTINPITAPNATNLQTAVDLSNNIFTEYSAHIYTGRFHHPNDSTNPISAPVATDLPSSIVLLEDLRNKYSSHVLLGGDPTAGPPTIATHAQPDLVNDVILDSEREFGVTNAKVTFGLGGNRIITAITSNLMNIIPGDWIMFLTGTNVGQKRSVSQVILNNQVAVSTAFTFVDPGGIIVRSATTSTPVGTISVAADRVTLTVPVNFPIGTVIQFTAGPNKGIKQTIVSSFSPTVKVVGSPYAVQDISGSAAAQIDPVVGTVPLVDQDSMIGLSNRIKSDFNAHRVRPGIHAFYPNPNTFFETDDVLNSITVSDAYNFASLLTLLNSIRSKYEIHRVGAYIHLNQDLADVPLGVGITNNSTTGSINFANDFKAKFNHHLSRPRTHIKDDLLDLIQTPDATDITSLITLLNEEKRLYNLHRVAAGIHVTNDTIYVVATPNATDEQSANTLAFALDNAYENHRVAAGVHGSSVLIQLNPPDRVLYNSMKFFQSPNEGVSGHVYPYSEEVTGVLHNTVTLVDIIIIL